MCDKEIELLKHEIKEYVTKYLKNKDLKNLFLINVLLYLQRHVLHTGGKRTFNIDC
jgi:hypothetical protein